MTSRSTTLYESTQRRRIVELSFGIGIALAGAITLVISVANTFTL